MGMVILSHIPRARLLYHTLFVCAKCNRVRACAAKAGEQEGVIGQINGVNLATASSAYTSPARRISRPVLNTLELKSGC